MDCVVTPLKTLMGFSVHLNVQLKFYNLPFLLVAAFNLVCRLNIVLEGITNKPTIVTLLW